jgi:hypothetical protein
MNEDIPNDVDPGLHHAYQGLVDRAKKTDPRWIEAQTYRAQAAALRTSRNDSLGEVSREELVQLIVRLDGKDRPEDLRRRHPSYIRELAAGACDRADMRLRQAVLDDAMDQALLRYSTSARSHADARIAIADMRARGAAAISERAADTEHAAVVEMISALRGHKKKGSN